MVASVSFFAGENFDIQEIDSSSGIGFYGDGFGVSIPVGEYNTRTFITSSNGTVEGPEVDNVQYVSSGSAILGQAGSPVALTAIPNYLATLRVQFENDTAVKTRNAEVRIYDRDDIDTAPDGVTCYVAEVVHTGTSQTNDGSGDTTWTQCYGSGSTLALVDSPGTSGLSPSGIDTTDTVHHWYLALSATPQSIGSKTDFGLYFSVEYLD